MTMALREIDSATAETKSSGLRNTFGADARFDTVSAMGEELEQANIRVSACSCATGSVAVDIEAEVSAGDFVVFT